MADPNPAETKLHGNTAAKPPRTQFRRPRTINADDFWFISQSDWKELRDAARDAATKSTARKKLRLVERVAELMETDEGVTDHRGGVPCGERQKQHACAKCMKHKKQCEAGSTMQRGLKTSSPVTAKKQPITTVQASETPHLEGVMGGSKTEESQAAFQMRTSATAGHPKPTRLTHTQPSSRTPTTPSNAGRAVPSSSRDSSSPEVPLSVVRSGANTRTYKASNGAVTPASPGRANEPGSQLANPQTTTSPAKSSHMKQERGNDNTIRPAHAPVPASAAQLIEKEQSARRLKRQREDDLADAEIEVLRAEATAARMALEAETFAARKILEAEVFAAQSEAKVLRAVYERKKAARTLAQQSG